MIMELTQNIVYAVRPDLRALRHTTLTQLSPRWTNTLSVKALVTWSLDWDWAEIRGLFLREG
jgi:hypothetical protein